MSSYLMSVIDAAQYLMAVAGISVVVGAGFAVGAITVAAIADRMGD